MAIASDLAPQAGSQQLYDVGGVLLEHPFKIRRLGHFGFDLVDMERGIPFYRDLLGFQVSDTLDWGRRLPAPHALDDFGDTNGYFMRYGTDHHAFVVFPKRVLDVVRPSHSGVTVNQITWQVGSLREVTDAVTYFQERNVPVRRTGRDTPGSNWHVYPADPDGQTNELYYGIEQVGWDGYSKPRTMYDRGFQERPSLPQIAEQDEVQQAIDRGVDLDSGYRYTEQLPRVHDVDGILLARPFKIVRIGPVRLFVQDMDAALSFYSGVMGFTLTEEVTFEGHRCVFLRAGLEHHSVALYPIALRERLGLSPHTTCLSFGTQLATYRQLRDALGFLAANGVQIRELPQELFPGIDYSAFAIDPDGHAIQLYYYMEQVGGGRRRSGEPRRAPASFADWPATLEAQPDTYAGESFLGPWG